MGELLQPYIEELRKIDSTKDYTNFVDKLYQYLKIERALMKRLFRMSEIRLLILKADFRPWCLNENMLKSKERLLFYLEKLQRVQKWRNPVKLILKPIYKISICF